LIKVIRHPLTCDCNDCATMFPSDRFEPAWTWPKPSETARRAEARLPLGHPRANLGFVVWVDADQRLLHDWPGFPGTAGARVEMQWYRPDSGRITGTRDPALAALADPIPLTRRFAERIHTRCMVDYGFAPEDTADFVACPTHGHGIPALACHCIVNAPADTRLEVCVLYDTDGDYPDLVCTACIERFSARDMSVVTRVCSRCQQANLHRHHRVARSWYGATEPFCSRLVAAVRMRMPPDAPEYPQAASDH
jgi:hypothetical protein